MDAISVVIIFVFRTRISQTIYFQVIAAEGEQKASRALREASEVIAESSSALQLRYLQVRTSSRHTHRIIKRSFGNYPPYYIFLCYYRHLTRSPPKRTPLSFSHCRLILSRTSWNLQKTTQKTTDGMRVRPTSSIGNEVRKKGWTMRPTQTKVKNKTLLLE